MRIRGKFFRTFAVAAYLYLVNCPLPLVAVVIGIDARNGTAADTLANGTDFDMFRATIASAGFTVVPVFTFDSGALAGLDAVMLRQSISTASNFTSTEIADVHAFVNAGHGLLLCGEGGFSSDATVANLNTLAASYGVVYSSTATEPAGYTITGFVPHPVTAGLSAIGVDFQRRLFSISPPASDLTLSAGADDALAVVNGGGGAGNVVLVSDVSDWKDVDSASDRNISFGDNQLLLKNIVNFIAVPEPTTGGLMGLGCVGLALLLVRARKEILP